MNTDGSSKTQLTNLGTVAAPSNAGGAIAWSPDSSKLAFVVGSEPVCDLGRQCERHGRACDHDAQCVPALVGVRPVVVA